ncbi:MAG: hypothetical protein SFY68_11800 [Candidatus Sumerlaeia bacterium]|nr:hypothetical protein [Candidatus Sumerlaeia bacterium]
MALAPKPLPSFDSLLNSSSSTPEFQLVLRDFEKLGYSNSPALRYNSGSPAVKVGRFLQQLLETYPEWKITTVEVEAQSGCSDYHGFAEVGLANGEKKRIRFTWDCAWKAEQEGLKTFFGTPDQQKAAQLFGYRCFQVFEVIS